MCNLLQLLGRPRPRFGEAFRDTESARRIGQGISLCPFDCTKPFATAAGRFAHAALPFLHPQLAGPWATDPDTGSSCRPARESPEAHRDPLRCRRRHRRRTRRHGRVAVPPRPPLSRAFRHRAYYEAPCSPSTAPAAPRLHMTPARHSAHPGNGPDPLQADRRLRKPQARHDPHRVDGPPLGWGLGWPRLSSARAAAARHGADN